MNKDNKNWRYWSVNEVGTWLDDNGLEKAGQEFRKAQYRGKDLEKLDFEKLDKHFRLSHEEKCKISFHLVLLHRSELPEIKSVPRKLRKPQRPPYVNSNLFTGLTVLEFEKRPFGFKLCLETDLESFTSLPKVIHIQNQSIIDAGVNVGMYVLCINNHPLEEGTSIRFVHSLMSSTTLPCNILFAQSKRQPVGSGVLGSSTESLVPHTPPSNYGQVSLSPQQESLAPPASRHQINNPPYHQESPVAVARPAHYYHSPPRETSASPPPPSNINIPPEYMSKKQIPVITDTRGLLDELDNRYQQQPVVEVRQNQQSNKSIPTTPPRRMAASAKDSLAPSVNLDDNILNEFNHNASTRSIGRSYPMPVHQSISDDDNNSHRTPQGLNLDDSESESDEQNYNTPKYHWTRGNSTNTRRKRRQPSETEIHCSITKDSVSKIDALMCSECQKWYSESVVILAQDEKRYCEVCYRAHTCKRCQVWTLEVNRNQGNKYCDECQAYKNKDIILTFNDFPLPFYIDPASTNPIPILEKVQHGQPINQHGQKIEDGDLLIKVNGVNVEGKMASGAIQILSNCQRPFTLTFRKRTVL